MNTKVTTLLITGIAIALFFSSCQTSQLSLGTARVTEVNGAIVHTPLLVDIDVQPKDSASDFFNDKTGSTPSVGEIEDAKSECLYLLLSKTKADEIISPSFDVKTNGSELTVKVKGFPAKYKNFRNATPADTSIIKMYKYIPYNQTITGQAGAPVINNGRQTGTTGVSNKNGKTVTTVVLVLVLISAAIATLVSLGGH